MPLHEQQSNALNGAGIYPSPAESDSHSIPNDLEGDFQPLDAIKSESGEPIPLDTLLVKASQVLTPTPKASFTSVSVSAYPSPLKMLAEGTTGRCGGIMEQEEQLCLLPNTFLSLQPVPEPDPYLFSQHHTRQPGGPANQPNAHDLYGGGEWM